MSSQVPGVSFIELPVEPADELDARFCQIMDAAPGDDLGLRQRQALRMV
jgi:hypothetical protein